MELATCTLALAGDAGNTIQKFDVTPSEIAVLRLIHGTDSVTEIEVQGDEFRTNRHERERLSQAYGKSEEGVFTARAVDQLFPGAAARFFDRFEELELDDSFYKAERQVPKKRAKAADEPATKPKKRAKPEPEQDTEPEQETELDQESDTSEDPDDGIDDMSDNIFK